MPGPIVADDIYRFRWIDHVRLSHDGERVAYQVGWADAGSRQNRSRIVVRRLLDPEPVEATGGSHRDHSPEWSPDGRRLAFVSRVGPSDQLFVTELAAGGETRQLSFVAEAASSPSWSPDAQLIAFIGTVPSDPDAVVDDPRPPEGREQMRRAPVARIARRLDYKHDGQGFVDGRYHHLFVVPASGGEARQLTSGAWDVTGFDWSPDSARLVVSGNAEPGADLQRELNLYLVDLEANRRRLGGGFNLSSPLWSPRGDLIAFIAPNGLDAGLIERLWVVPLTGGGPRCLTSAFDQAVGDSIITDMRAGHGARVCWSAQGDRLLFTASGPGVTGVYSVDLESNVRQEAGGRRRIYDFDFARGVLAFCASDTGNPGELYMLTEGAEARLTELNPWMHDRYVAQPEHHNFTAPDGWQLEGWLLKPENMDVNRLHPLVMEVHGGPHGQYGWAFFHELQILAGMGYVVLYLNPRGSDGYGERFRREVVRDWGGKDYLDLMSALDQVMDRTGYVDRNRMGVGGGSYGGYMTNWIIGQTDRFSAAVSMRSISNLVSEYSQHDIVLWGTLELGPPPWPDLDELWRRSPIRYVQNIRTPLLLTCGEMDLRCAISQSEELFGALRLLGKTVELVRFPEESHDLSRSGRPDRRIERLRRIGAWFERFLGTAAADRYSDEETQVLSVPAEAPREWAKTLPQVDEVLAAGPAVEAAISPEPHVIQPAVTDTMTAEQPIIEPDALPDLPVPGAPGAAMEIEPEAETAPPEGEAPKKVETAAEAAQPEPVQAQRELVDDQPEVAPAQAKAEPVEEKPEAEPVEPQPEPEPVQPAAEPEPAHEPEPAPVAAAVHGQAHLRDVSSTVVAWPATSPVRSSNGSPATNPPAFEEATSVMPALQHPPAEAKRTVSLRALPPEQLASGAGFAALLTFEAGPFAGRVVALPSQMVNLGRAPDNDIVVGDPATSGHHGRIEVRAGSFWFSDLGSTNGTQVNGEPVIEQQLEDGDLIAIGQNAIRFTLEA